MGIHANAFVAGERVLLEATAGILILTTHRVRLTQGGAGDRKVISLTLDAVASCRIVTVTYPALLGLGLVGGIVGLGLMDSSEPGAGAFFLIAALISVLAFLLGRRAVLEVGSAAAKIQVEAKGMSHDALMEFIDTLERAKLSRESVRANPRL